MYDSQLFRLNIKGIKNVFNEETKELKISIMPFVEYKSSSYEEGKRIERQTEATITLDFGDRFSSESHSNIRSLVNDLNKVQWFKTKNVIVEHAWDDEVGYETLSILSNSEDSIELKDMLYCGYETDKNGNLSYFCTLDTQYFLNQQDCPFIRNSFVSANSKSFKTIREDAAPLVATKQKKQTLVENKTSDTTEYYPSKKDALQSIAQKDRKIGQVVWVKLSKSRPKADCWKNGLLDKDLIPVEN